MPARVTYFTLPIQGHVTPSVPVVAELARRGVSVDAFASADQESKLTAAGADVHPYPSILPDLFRAPSSNPVIVAAMLAKVTHEELLAFAVDRLRQRRPDVVLVDSMAPWGRLAARRLGLPVATTTCSFVFNPRIGMSRPALRASLDDVPGALAALARLTRLQRRMRRLDGVDPGGPVALLSNRGDTTITYTSRTFQPAASAFGADVQFVGSTLADPATPGGPSVAERPPDQADARELLAAVGPGPLIYVALGTIYNDRPAFMRSCIDALSDTGRPLVIATGTTLDLRALGTVGPHVHLVPFAPQLPLLRRADLFVTHGGMNSVSEALWFGVPMLVFPQGADQPIVADRVQTLGAGRVLRGREPTSAEISSAAQLVLGDGSAARSAARMGDGLRLGGGATAAADAILALAR